MPRENSAPSSRRQEIIHVPWQVLPAKALEQVIKHIEQVGENNWPEVGQMRQRLYDLKILELASTRMF